MVRTISQEAYDEVVRENMEEFSMPPEEAIQDAIKQFEAQGVDLKNILKDLAMTSKADTQLISSTLKKLENLVKSKSTTKAYIIQELDIVKTECDKDLPHRVLAGKEGAYDITLDLLLLHENDKEITTQCLKTMIALMTTQPDLLNPTGIELIIKYINKEQDCEILHLVLKWVRECCLKHEYNRQHIFDAGILDRLVSLLPEASAQLLRDELAVMRALVLDDDVRVEYGKAHEHARIIASSTLCPIIDLLAKYKTDETVVGDLMLTLSALIVRNEFCKKVEDAGGLLFILEALQDFPESEKLNRQALKLLKVLAGNDECKVHIIQKGGAQHIANCLIKHKGTEKTAIIGLNCIAALTLRAPENSKVLFDIGFAEIIVDCMKEHPDSMNVQKSASWAIRNMVSRTRDQCDKFLSQGVEEILQADLKKFKKDCEFDIKAALRDLGCKVDLKEEWTGKGGKLNTQQNKSSPME